MTRAIETTGGTILIESAPGSGRVNVTLARGMFNIRLPLDVADATAIAEALDASVVEATPAPKGRTRGTKA